MPFRKKSCSHLNTIDTIKHPQSYECKLCKETGDKWVHLRTCQDCGITLCCDSSPNQHASKHARSHKHMVISSAEPGEKWLWCYEHKTIKEF